MAKVYRKITKELGSLSMEDFETSVEGIIGMLQQLQAEHPNYTLYLREDYGYDYYENSSFDVMGDRLETDIERSKRIAKARKESAAQKERRQAETIHKEQEEKKYYEKLKVKYGKS